jgi:O-antigen ligase
MGAYLLHLCDSKTSITALILGTCVLVSVKLPVVRQRVGAVGAYTVGVFICFWAVDSLFGVKQSIVQELGRDMTFTGRTDVWRELLSLHTDPIIGTGFCSFWSNQYYLSKLPYWVAFSAHNGYVETYIDGGMIGVFFLILMLFATGLKLNRRLATGGNYALFRFSVLLVIIVASFSESHFARMGPLWFIFLVVALDPPCPDAMTVKDEESEDHTPVFNTVRIVPGDMAPSLIQTARAQ